MYTYIYIYIYIYIHTRNRPLVDTAVYAQPSPRLHADGSKDSGVN